MKIIAPLIFIILLGYVGWPYVNLFRLDRALITNNQTALTSLVDLEAVKAARKQSIEVGLKNTVGDRNTMPDIVRQGVHWIGGSAVDTMIDMDWVRETLRWKKDGRTSAYPSIISAISFAFFESPTNFLIRIGELGFNPIHMRMQLRDWHWRVIGIYD